MAAACGGGGSGSDPTTPSAPGGNPGGGGNAAPTISGTPATTVQQDSSYAFTPAASDPDLDRLTFSIANRPSWAGFNTNTGALTGTPNSGDLGTTNNVVISVSDGVEVVSLPAFSITVTAPSGGSVTVSNTQPGNYRWNSLDAGEPVYIDRNYTFQQIPAEFRQRDYLMTANDDKFASGPGSISFDIDRPAKVYVGYDVTIATLPTWLQSWTNTGTILDGSATDYRLYEKDFNAGTVSLGGNEMGFSMYVVVLGNDSTSAAPGNRAPVISGGPNSTAAAGNFYFFLPSASDPDGDTLSFTVSNKPSWLVFGSQTGALTGTPGPGDVGTYNNISITVSDGQLSASLASFSITVIDAGGGNAAPNISGTPRTNVAENSFYSFTPTASDIDGDSLTFSISNKPAWANFNSGNGALTGTPDGNDAGVYANIVISVTDGMATSSLPAFGIVVSDTPAPNGSPTISGTPASSVAENSSYSFTPTANDPDGDSLTFSIQNKPSWASFNTATGRLSGTPGSSAAGSYNNIRISVSDGVASASLPAFNINVIDNTPTGSATLSWTPPTTNEDGSSLSDLAGYRIYYGLSLQANCKNYPNSEQINNAGVASAVIDSLGPGTWHFSVTAYDTSGNESSCSNNASKTIP